MFLEMNLSLCGDEDDEQLVGGWGVRQSQKSATLAGLKFFVRTKNHPCLTMINLGARKQGLLPVQSDERGEGARRRSKIR